MPAIEEICEYLEDQSVGTVGTDLFGHRLPAGKTEGMVVSQYPGSVPEVTCGSDGTRIQMPRMQFRARYASDATAVSKAEAAAAALNKIANESIEGRYWRSVVVLQEPGLLYADLNDMPNWGFNFEGERSAS